MDNLLERFLGWVDSTPDAPALRVSGVTLSYRDLLDEASSIALQLDEGSAPIGILAARSVAAYAGVLAALLAGRTYVPLNPRFPVERLRDAALRAGTTHIVTDSSGAALKALPPMLPSTTFLALSDGQVSRRDLRPVYPPRLAGPEDIAYLLFTSGSTGVPKGVGITHRNAVRLITSSLERYTPGPGDRLSQTFDLVFDLSVFDMFVAWSSGACLCAANLGDLMTPAAYIQREGITIWFSVPSMARHIEASRALTPNAFPALRWSLFCGEALLAETAAAWAVAAPQSIIENLYGPTELTVYCTVFRYTDSPSPPYENGVVHIGDPLPELSVRVVDPHLREVGIGETGELVASGTQRAPGYWKDPERTAQSFVHLPDVDGIWYRTGDRVRRPAKGEPIAYLGRLDRQVQVRGNRVELGEVEHRLSQMANAPVAVIAVPHRAACAEHLVVVVATSDHDAKAFLRESRKVLPPYMQPRQCYTIDSLPLNSNGKVDYNALAAWVAER